MEYSELIVYAKEYLSSTCSMHALHGAASEYLRTQFLKPGEVHGVARAEEWLRMINSHWNEWGLIEQPLSANEFHAWLSSQIEGSDRVIE